MDDPTTSYESFYGGSFTPMESEYGTGFQMSASHLGFPGSPQTADQLHETVNAIKQGTKTFEVELLGVQDSDQAVPKQHFNEMRALMKLTGVKPSVHGPLIDPAGFGEKGWGGEAAREDNERRMFQAVERAHALDPKGNIPIVFHSANGAPGSEFVPGDDDPKSKDRFVMEKGAMINRETGQVSQTKRERKFRPEHPDDFKEGGTLFTAESRIGSANVTDWENKLTDLATFSKHAEEIMGQPKLFLAEYVNAEINRKNGQIKDAKTNEVLPEMSAAQAGQFEQMKKADIFLENIELNFASAFHDAYKYGSKVQKKELKTLSEKYNEDMNKIKENGTIPVFAPELKKNILEGAINGLKNVTKERAIRINGKPQRDKDHGAPKLYQQAEEFAMEQASETFGNLATRSYDEFGKDAPTLAVENMWQGFAFSRAKDLKELVKKSRKNFANQLMTEKNMSEGAAKKIAKKQIGVTWDVGHLNQMRKRGFTEEDIVEETKTIAPLVKHIHLTDNFGYSDSHLAPGMGNVPFKKILKELEKTGRLKEMHKIVESGGFAQHFKKSPLPWTLSAFSSPIYGAKMGPTWNQASELQGAYSGGYGNLNPQQHHTMYGAGFTTMPVELGGMMPGGNSRFGGTPMA